MDWISLNTIANSEFIRSAFSAKGLVLPKSRNSVLKLIKEQYLSVQSDITESIRTQIQAGDRYTVTMDGWTSVANVCNMIANLHLANGQFYNLGLAELGDAWNS